MKLARLGLGIILSLVLLLSVCPAVQADDEAGVDLTATVALNISAVSASGTGYYGTAISWETNGDATSQVFYDTESHENIDDYANSTIEEITLVSKHSVLLTGLASSTTYHYQVRSAVPDTDFVATSGDYTFTTLTLPVGGGGGGGFGPAPGPPAGTTDVSGMVSEVGVFQEPATALSEDGLCTFTIPEGTVGLTADLEPLNEINIQEMDDPPAPPEDANVIGLTYDFGPDGATFDPPITLTFSYDPADIPEGGTEEDLVIAWYDEVSGEWVELEGCVVDPETNTITAPVSHFTAFRTMFFILTPAAFSLSTLAVSPAEAEIGSPIAISALVKNTGEKMGILRVILKIDGKVEQVEYIALDPGASKEVSFTTSRDTAGSYAVDVNGLTGSFTIKEKPALPTPTPVPSKPVSWPVIGGIIAGVVAIAAIIMTVLRHRRAVEG